jgi:CheY-like chemotaxis protein
MRRSGNRVSLDYKILIVDDEPGIIDSLSVVLKRSGYQLTELQTRLRPLKGCAMKNSIC